jgi:excisionase family DNA binding protein
MSKMLVTLTVEELQDLVRSEVRDAIRNHSPQVKPRSPFLDSEEAAEYLRMPVGVLRKRTAKGEIPHFKIGAVLRYKITDLDAFCEAQKKAG